MRKMIFMIMLAAAAPAEARVWGAPAGWQVEDLDDACGVEREFEGAGSTRMGFSTDVDGESLLWVTNWNWSANEKLEVKLIIRVGDETYTATGLGMKSGINKGFVIKINQEMINDIERSNGITFYRAGDKPVLIDDLALDGTSAAVSLMRRCLVDVQARVRKERADKARLSHIPTDPFAPQQEN